MSGESNGGHILGGLHIVSILITGGLKNSVHGT